ncbi:MAG: hypothetical protein QM831_22255 [Kofleriaceae bacterium]
MRFSLLLVGLTTVLATAAPPPKWTIRERVPLGGKIHYVAIAEVDRTGTITPIAAPELDKISNDTAVAWKTYKPAPSIKITEFHADSISMSGDNGSNHTFTFTANEPLYPVAALRAFADAQGLELAGMGVSFMEFDTHRPPPTTYDGLTTFDHFRKSTAVPNFGDRDYILGFFKKSLRTNDEQHLDDARYVSPTNKHIKLARDTSPDDFTVAWVKLFKDGHVEYTQKFIRDELMSRWTKPVVEDAELSIYDGDTYVTKKVPKSSPMNFEAQIVQRLEKYGGYDLEPAIDVATIK